MRIDENLSIWMLHSQTIKEHKSPFFLSLKDIKLMYYSADYESKCLQIKFIIFPMFSAENKLSIQIRIRRFLRIDNS